MSVESKVGLLAHDLNLRFVSSEKVKGRAGAYTIRLEIRTQPVDMDRLRDQLTQRLGTVNKLLVLPAVDRKSASEPQRTEPCVPLDIEVQIHPPSLYPNLAKLAVSFLVLVVILYCT